MAWTFFFFTMFYRNACGKIRGGILLEKTYQHQALYSLTMRIFVCLFILAQLYWPEPPLLSGSGESWCSSLSSQSGWGIQSRTCFYHLLLLVCRVFVRNRCYILLNTFSIEMIVVFLFKLLIWYYGLTVSLNKDVLKPSPPSTSEYDLSWK